MTIGMNNLGKNGRLGNQMYRDWETDRKSVV